MDCCYSTETTSCSTKRDCSCSKIKYWSSHTCYSSNIPHCVHIKINSEHLILNVESSQLATQAISLGCYVRKLMQFLRIIYSYQFMLFVEIKNQVYCCSLTSIVTVISIMFSIGCSFPHLPFNYWSFIQKMT